MDKEQREWHFYRGILDRSCLRGSWRASGNDSPNFTAAPGKDDNADFYVPFEADDEFFVFAHFAVECAE